MIAKIRIINDPEIIGLNKYSTETLPIITIIGFPPAGGCVTFNNIIRPTPNPTANGIIINNGKGIKYKKKIPTLAVTRCPKKTFLGLAKGLSGYPYNKTIDDPKDAMRKIPNSVL